MRPLLENKKSIPGHLNVELINSKEGKAIRLAFNDNTNRCLWETWMYEEQWEDIKKRDGIWMAFTTIYSILSRKMIQKIKRMKRPKKNKGKGFGI